MSKYTLGWFGVPGRNEVTKTHILCDGKPICGTKMRPEMEFQFCSHYPGLYEPECRTCQRLALQRGLTRNWLGTDEDYDDPDTFNGIVDQIEVKILELEQKYPKAQNYYKIG